MQQINFVSSNSRGRSLASLSKFDTMDVEVVDGPVVPASDVKQQKASTDSMVVEESGQAAASSTAAAPLTTDTPAEPETQLLDYS